MDPTISVIVSVYNTEHYLHRCIDSILSQSFTDFELLLINDGSSDRSGEICDEYAGKDKRVRVFHKENGGVSSARNLGLDEARGEWVAFVDSDDWILKGAFEIVTNNNDDLIICSFQNQSGMENQSYTFKNSIINDPIELKRFYSSHIHETTLKVIWSKFFRKSLIGYLRFDSNIRIGEDYLFILQYLAKVNRCCISENLCYCYHEGDIPFYMKYQLSIYESIYILSELFAAYERLNIQSIVAEIWMFLDYRRLCRRELDRKPSLWYKNLNVICIYKKIKKNLGWNFRVRYRLLSIPLFIKINKIISCI